MSKRNPVVFDDIETQKDAIRLLTFLEENSDLGSTDLNRLRRAIRKLMHIRERLKYLYRTETFSSASSKKGKRNPSLVVYDNPAMRVRIMNEGRVVGIIGTNVHQVKYEHAEDGESYYHDFDKGVKLIALDNGDVLLTSDKPLWEDFD